MAVIFDMDGVLFDSEPIHIRAWQAVLSSFGVQVTAADFHRWIGIPDAETAEHFYTEYGVGGSNSALLARKREQFYRLTTAELRPFAGLTDALRELAAHGIPVAVATSACRENAEHTLACTGLRDFFPIVVASEDVPHPKPAPDAFLRAAALLVTPPAGCIVVEDSPTGVRAARAAGCTVAGVTSSYSAAGLAEADCVFATTPEAIHWALTRH